MLTKNSDEDKFMEILHEVLDNNSIKLGTKLEDTALDSLKYISLVVRYEKTFDMQFDDVSLLMHNFTTVNDLYDYVIGNQ